MMHDIVFLFDVDNTLLNNDRVQADLDVHIGVEHGAVARNRYWEIFEALRRRTGLCRLSGCAGTLPAGGDARSAVAADVELAGGLSVRRAAVSAVRWTR